MKKIPPTFFFLSCIIFNVHGQYVFNQCNSRPVYGDSLTGIMNQYDSAGVAPGSFGANATWNYNSLTLSSTSALKHYYSDPSNTVGSFMFPKANLADKGDGPSYSYYNYGPDSISYYGNFADSSVYLSAWDPQVQNRCPNNFGTSYTDFFSRHNLGTCPYHLDYTNRKVSYDAYGTINFPENSFSVFRLKIIEHTVDTAQGCGLTPPPPIISSNSDSTYLWIDISTGQPVFSIHYSIDVANNYANKFVTAYSYSHYPAVSAATGISLSPEQEQAIVIYPNPTSGAFQLQVNNKQPSLISIYNVLGEKVYEQLFSEQRLTNGVSLIPVNLSKENNGVYFLQMKTEQGTIMKKIVID